jgi:hypothetical protein
LLIAFSLNGEKRKRPYKVGVASKMLLVEALANLKNGLIILTFIEPVFWKGKPGEDARGNESRFERNLSWITA